jgi:hypothetical protein
MSRGTHTAICLSCGTSKDAPWRCCGTCGFDPGKDSEALVRSVYFSAARFDDEPEQSNWAAELPRIAAEIRAGVTPQPIEAELSRLRAQLAAVEQTTSAQLASGVARIFLPGIVLITVLLGLWIVLRWVNR